MKNSLAYILVLGIIMGGIFYYTYSEQFSNRNIPVPTKGTEESQKHFLLKIVGKKLIDRTEKILAVKQGDTVTIEILSDENDELHLHGYDKAVEIKKEMVSSITFVAHTAGRFVFELEKSKVELGFFEVYP